MFGSKGIVALAAPHLGRRKTSAKFQTLYSGDAVDNLGNPALHAAEHRFSDSRWQPGNHTVDFSANTVSILPGLFNALPHGQASFRVDYWEVIADLGNAMQRKRIIFPSAAGNAENPGANLNAPLLQPLLAQTTGDAQGSGEPPGKMPAASCILKTSIFYLDRKSVV